MINDKEICEYYLKNDISLTELGEKFDTTRRVVTRILKANNITIRNINNQKYNYHEDYFKNIDSEEKAYKILDWLYSDCNIKLDRKLNTFNNLKIKYFNRLPSMNNATGVHG